MSTNDNIIHNQDEMIAEPSPPSPSSLVGFGNILEQFRCTSIRFTPDDDDCISYNNQDILLAFWDITAGREITDKMNITYNSNNNIRVWSIFSPTGQWSTYFSQLHFTHFQRRRPLGFFSLPHIGKVKI
jgi:hypothetical protein